MYEVAIIGTGPAGISAALTLKQLNKDFIIFGSDNLSFKINKAHKIRNYPGLIDVSGSEMKEVFLKQLKEMDIKITNKIVSGIYKKSDSYSILCGKEEYEAKCVIVTTGVLINKPFKGEIENVGMGVSYCATCDGFLYKGKDIIIYSESNEFDLEIDYLLSIANKAYLFLDYDNYKFDHNNYEIINDKIDEIKSSFKSKEVITKNGQSINANGIFILKSVYSPSILIPGIELDGAHIKVNRKMETSYKGLFAAGDVTGRPYQYTKAVGEGNVSAHSAVEYLALNK